jgi:hypothetical protein
LPLRIIDLFLAAAEDPMVQEIASREYVCSKVVKRETAKKL